MNTLKVQKRDMAKKAKELRREGFVTGTLFGKELNGSIPVIIEKKEAERIHRECFKGSQLFVELDGKKYDVLLKEVDYDAMKRQILELDFQALVKGEKVHSVAEIVLHNKEKVVGGILEQLLEEVAYKATPEHLGERIDRDCSDWKIGDVRRLRKLQKPRLNTGTPTKSLLPRAMSSFHTDWKEGVRFLWQKEIIMRF